MGGTQTAAKGNDAGQVVPAVALLSQILDLGHSLLHDVAQPLLIAADAPIGVTLRVGPCLLVHGVDGEDHDLPGLDPRGKGIVHVEVLKIEEAAILTGDVQHRAACVAVDLALHVAAQRRTVILEILHLPQSRLTPCQPPLRWGLWQNGKVSVLPRPPSLREVASRSDDGRSSFFTPPPHTSGCGT